MYIHKLFNQPIIVGYTNLVTGTNFHVTMSADPPMATKTEKNPSLLIRAGLTYLSRVCTVLVGPRLFFTIIY